MSRKTYYLSHLPWRSKFVFSYYPLPLAKINCGLLLLRLVTESRRLFLTTEKSKS